MKYAFLLSGIGVLTFLLFPTYINAGAPAVGSFVLCPHILTEAEVDINNIGKTPKDWFDAWIKTKGKNSYIYTLSKDKLPTISIITFEYEYHKLAEDFWSSWEDDADDKKLISAERKQTIESKCDLVINQKEINGEISKWAENLHYRPSNLYIVPYSQEKWDVIDKWQSERREEIRQDPGRRSGMCWLPYQKKIGDWIVVHESNYSRLCYKFDFFNKIVRVAVKLFSR